MITLVCIASGVPSVSADIYVWTDANGVKNFTNTAPPEQAVVFMETSEIEAGSLAVETFAEIARIESEPLQSELLKTSQEEIEALTEQVEGLRRELREVLEPVPEQPPVNETAVIESPERVRYRTSIGFGFYPFYNPYGYLWHHKLKNHHRRPGYGNGWHKKAIPFKHRIKHYGPSKKKNGRHGVKAGKGHSGYQKSRPNRHRSLTGGSRRHNGSRAGYRGGVPRRR